ncbi:MAG: hypothetical protein EX258_05355, partial [Sphingomonadaceae bacterium]
MSNPGILEEAGDIIAQDDELIEDTVEMVEAPVTSTYEWLGDNWEGLLIGAAVALGFVGLMLIIRWLGRSYRRKTQDRTSWKGIISGVFAKTTLVFMVVTALHQVGTHTDIPD